MENILKQRLYTRDRSTSFHAKQHHQKPVLHSCVLFHMLDLKSILQNGLIDFYNISARQRRNQSPDQRKKTPFL